MTTVGDGECPAVLRDPEGFDLFCELPEGHAGPHQQTLTWAEAIWTSDRYADQKGS